MKKNFSALAAAAIGVIGVASAAQAATVTLGLSYIGTTSATNMTSLTAVNLSNPTYQTPAYYSFFAVTVSNFTPDAGTSEYLRFLTYNLNITGGGNGTLVPPAAGACWVANNPSVGTTGGDSGPMFSTDGDTGSNTRDDLAMQVIQGDAALAGVSLVGQPGTLLTGNQAGGGNVNPVNTVGRFRLQFTGPISQDLVLSLSRGDGNAFNYFDASGNEIDNYNAGDFMGGSLTIPASVTTPEPASLGVLALGGLALLARRRRA